MWVPAIMPICLFCGCLLNSVHFINATDTGGRTVQALPKETQFTRQVRRQKNYYYKVSMFIIYLLYIE